MDKNRAAITRELVVIVLVVALLLTAAGFLVSNVVTAVRALDGAETSAGDAFSFEVGDVEKALRDLAGKILPADAPKSQPPAPAAPAAPADRAKQPGENKKAAVTSVRFFEAGKDIPRTQARQYAAQFSPQARYVYVEIGVKHNRYKIADSTLQFAVQCFDPAGSKTDERKLSAKAGKETASGFVALPLDAAKAGGWKAGQYTVKVFLDGENIGEYKFAIQ